MRIIGFEKLSLVDFDGHTACTLFVGECNFRCPFCHNGDLVLNSSNFTEYDEQEIFAYLKKRKGLLDGVVISGGEPTLHKDLPDFIKRIKEIGYDVKLDTNGTNPDMLKYLVQNHLIDYVAMDIKSGINGYGRAIGLKGFPKKVAESVEYLKSNVINYEFRTTLVNELITQQDILDMASWLQGARVLFLQHFIERDGCIKKGLNEVCKSTALQYADILINSGIPCKLRNYD